VPLYDYECEPCGDVNEVYHGMFDDAPVACVSCGVSMRKLVTGERVTMWTQPIQRTEGFASKSLPLNYAAHKKAGGTFNARGECVFENKRRIRETLAVARDDDPGLTWDGRI